MSNQHYNSVVELVLEILRDPRGGIERDRLVEMLRTHFPRVQWHDCYWHWYIEQCTHGRFQHLFSREQREQLAQTSPVESDRDKGVEIHLANLAPIRKAARAALRYEDAMLGTRRLNLTSHIGQILACYHLKLRLCVDPHQRDDLALDRDQHLIQIKTRRLISPPPAKEDNRLGRLPQSDTAQTLLVQLDHQYNLLEIWQAETQALLAQQKPGRTYLHLNDFMAIAQQAWPKSRHNVQPEHSSTPAIEIQEVAIPVEIA